MFFGLSVKLDNPLLYIIHDMAESKLNEAKTKLSKCLPVQVEELEAILNRRTVTSYLSISESQYELFLI